MYSLSVLETGFTGPNKPPMSARRNAPQPFGMPEPLPVDEGGTPEKGEGTPEMGDRKMK